MLIDEHGFFLFQSIKIYGSYIVNLIDFVTQKMKNARVKFWL